MQNLNYEIQIKTVDNEVVQIASNKLTGEALTINFYIKRTVDSTLNSMDLKIYNLNPNTRSKLIKDKYSINEYVGIKLKAGRKINKLIFEGNVRRSWTERQGTEIITNFNCEDGGFMAYNAQSNLSFAAGTSEEEMIKALSEDAKKQGIQEVVYTSDPNIGVPKLKKGQTYHGQTLQQIKQAAPDKMVYIDNEVVYVVPPIYIIAEGEKQNIKVINSGAGLLGVPMRENGFMTVETMFTPDISVADFIQIESSVDPQFDGQFKVAGIIHSGTISGAVDSSCKTILQFNVGDLNLKNITK